MKAFFKAIVILALLSMGGAVLWIHFSDKEVVVLADGTIKTVDEIWESGDSIFYEVENEIFLLDQHEIKSYGKRNFGHLILEVKTSVVKGFESFETEINQLFKKNNISVDLNLAQYVFLLGLPLFLTVLFFTRRSAKKRPESVAEVKDSLPRPEKKETDEVSTRIDIVCFFLNLFKQQIGAEPDAPVEYVSLSSKNSGPNQIYELRVKHMEDWTKRRMTIGPLGEESGSKSKCYYVIYDVHMVVKIPAKPLTDFEQYIESIKKEVQIVNKLIPKECIIPNVSVILGMIHSFPHSEGTPLDRLEERYIDWMRRSPEYQEYLKIDSTFVYIMDLSKYYFLSHILDELHDIKHLIAREITDNAEIIWGPTKFKGRYGTENDAFFEIRDLYNRCAVNIRRLVDSAGITATISDYQIQSWFIMHLANEDISANGSGYPDNFISDLNRLIEKAIRDNSTVIEVYRKTIKDYIYLSSFEQNKAQMAAISVNLLDILAWFRTKRVSMRDLKPDNLFVAGDPQRYPLFLRSAQEFSLGIIDVETAVDFEKSKYVKTKQPLLGGTPIYATPSHFIKNDILKHSFGNLGKILHLQDWHATLVMIYKVITGELLFDQTAKLLGELRDMMIRANQTNGDQAEDIVEEASRMFWHSAVAEFQLKTAESAQALKSIVLPIPEPVQEMFGKVSQKERKSITRSIQESVETQSIFEKDPIREVLLKASHSKICQFRADLERKAKDSDNLAGLRTEAITFLHELADLKARLGQQAHLQKLLSQPDARLSAHDILTFMFNVVVHNMYKPHWAPLSGETAVACEAPDGETILADAI
jgi:serine/threonine protein kinase